MYNSLEVLQLERDDNDMVTRPIFQFVNEIKTVYFGMEGSPKNFYLSVNNIQKEYFDPDIHICFGHNMEKGFEIYNYIIENNYRSKEHTFVLYNFSEYNDSDEWIFEIPDLNRIKELHNKLIELSSF